METRIVTLTCETEGCENMAKPIDLLTDATQYMCGACFNLITNVVENAGTDA